MPTAPLNESSAVVLDGSGNGTVQIGPLSALETWHPQNVHVSASSATKEATCAVYVGNTVQPRCFRDQTFTGSSGDSSDRVNADVVTTGAYVFAVWQGGDAGATATLTVTGTRDI